MSSPDSPIEPLEQELPPEGERGHHDEIESRGLLSRLSTGARKQFYTTVALAGSFFGGAANVEAQAPAAAPVLVAAANNRPVVAPTPLEKPKSVSSSETTAFIDEVKENNQRFADVWKAAHKSRASENAHRDAAVALLEELRTFPVDQNHAKQIWAFLGQAFAQAKMANDVDLLDQVLEAQRIFGIAEDSIRKDKIKNFIDVLLKAPSVKQQAMVKGPLFERFSEAFKHDAYDDMLSLATKSAPVFKSRANKDVLANDLREAHRVYLAAKAIKPRYDEAKKKLDDDPANGPAHKEMSLIYMGMKEDWTGGLEFLQDCGDAQLQNLATRTLNERNLFLSNDRVDQATADRLIHLGQEWGALANIDRDMQEYANRLTMTCYLRARKSANPMQVRNIDEFLRAHRVRPVHFKEESPDMAEALPRTMDLLDNIKMGSDVVGKMGSWSVPIINKKRSKDLWCLGKVPSYLVAPVIIEGDYNVDAKIVVTKPNYIAFELPIKGRKVLLSMNRADPKIDQNQAFIGLSTVNGQELPPEMRKPDYIGGGEFNVHIEVRCLDAYGNDLATILVKRSDREDVKFDLIDINSLDTTQDLTQALKAGEKEGIRGLGLSTLAEMQYKEIFLTSLSGGKAYINRAPDQQNIAANAGKKN